MHSQLIFLMRTCHFIIVKKRIAVTPGITGETISVLCEIDLLRHNNKSHVLLRIMTKIASQRQRFFYEGTH